MATQNVNARELIDLIFYTGIFLHINMLSNGFLFLFSLVDGFKLPVIFSFPHFLYADPIVQNSVVGLNPVEEEHHTVIDQEPVSSCIKPFNYKSSPV